MSTSRIPVAVVGASGYAGGELLRLLSGHPRVTLAHAFSETYAGKALSASFPGMTSDQRFQSFSGVESCRAAEVIFLAQDHGKAMKLAQPFLSAGKKVIDISSDFRLRDSAAYQTWYKEPHQAVELLASAIYGLPELNRDQIKGASLVANPGCYPTAAALALIPLLEEQLLDPATIVIDAKSGVSGAGRGKHSLDFHFPELNENCRPYAVGGAHRHTPEIEQTLSQAVGKAVTVSFTPHLIPMTRGILASCYATLKGSAVNASQVVELYKRRYQSHPFVRVLEAGQLPTTKSTFATNQCHLGFALDERTKRISVFSTIDNLVKGAAGQAVQNFNLMCGLEETAGLEMPGVWP